MRQRLERPAAPRRARPVLGTPTYVAPRYHSHLWSRLIFLLLIVALCGGVGLVGGVYWSIHRPQNTSSRIVMVHVGSGDTVTSLANRLQRKGLINSTLLFHVDARLQSLGGKLRIGDFRLRQNMSIDQMVAAFSQVPFVQYVDVTLREGLRSEQMAPILQQRGINSRQFLQEVAHPTLSAAQYSILQSKPRSASLEGYLFPNTYKVPKHSSGRAFAAFMVQTLNQNFTPAMRAQAAKEHLTPFQVLILASIVEREARVASERPLIASVYLNRLHQHQGLYADPTVQYAVGKPGNWWPVLTTAQLHTPSPYNTYVHMGLPPGPIANPGLASIQAVVYPKHTQFLYFVAKGNGHHAFEMTLAQHNADVCKYEGC